MLSSEQKARWNPEAERRGTNQDRLKSDEYNVSGEALGRVGSQRHPTQDKDALCLLGAQCQAQGSGTRPETENQHGDFDIHRLARIGKSEKRDRIYWGSKSPCQGVESPIDHS